MAATAEDYAWFIETYAIGLDFCLTFVRGLGPDELIGRLGGPEPVEIVGASLLQQAARMVRDLPDLDGFDRTTGLTFVAATELGDWTMIAEPNGYLGVRDAVVRELSQHGELVSFYYNENTTPQFIWAREGEILVSLDPGFPQVRTGSDPDRLNNVLADLGFDLSADDSDADDHSDDWFQERTLALMDRLTGVRTTGDRLDNAAFRCAGVPDANSWGRGTYDPARSAPFVAEVREELAAYAAEQDEYGDDRIDLWAEHGVTDKRLKATEFPGILIFNIDRDLLRAIAYAPPELHHRLTEWVQDRAFTQAEIHDQPWFAPIRDALRRGEPVPESGLHLADQHLDPPPTQLTHGPGGLDRPSRQLLVRKLLRAREATDPAAKVCEIVCIAADIEGGRYNQVVNALRQDFPELLDLEIPPPPPVRERAPARRKREARERREQEWRRQDEARYWGGRGPGSDRLRQVAMWAVGLAHLDRDLVDQIAAAEPSVQRAMAAWAARCACEQAAMMELDWVAEGVDALERGDPPPPSFADSDAAFARWRGVPRESVTHHATIELVPFGQDRELPRIDPASLAIHVVVTARQQDPLIAALDALHSAARVDPDHQTATIVAFRTAFVLPPATGTAP